MFFAIDKMNTRLSATHDLQTFFLGVRLFEGPHAEKILTSLTKHINLTALPSILPTANMTRQTPNEQQILYT